MNSKTTLFVLLSLIFGVAAVYLAQSWLTKNNQTVAPPQSTQVITMATNVAMGTILEGKHLTQTLFPDDLIPANAVTDFEFALGMLAKQRLYQGEVLRDERIIKKGEGSTLASLISPNKRAITIRVNDVVGVAGFLLPGNRVDVLSLYKKANKKFYTEIVLANIKILAIDQRASNDENKPTVVRAVTLEVNLKQAETLMVAKGRGSLQLALRNPNDQLPVIVAKVKTPTPIPLPQLLTKAAPEPKIVVRYVSPKKSKVYLIKGINEQEVKMPLAN